MNITLNELSTGKPVHTHIELLRPISVLEFRLILSNRWDISSQHPKSNIKKSENSIFEKPAHPIPKNEIKNAEKEHPEEIEDEINLEELFNSQGKKVQPQQQQQQQQHLTQQPEPPPPTPPPLPDPIIESENSETSPAATEQPQQLDDEIEDEVLLHTQRNTAYNSQHPATLNNTEINTQNVQFDISQKYNETLNRARKEQVFFKLTKNM